MAFMDFVIYLQNGRNTFPSKVTFPYSPEKKIELDKDNKFILSSHMCFYSFDLSTE